MVINCSQPVSEKVRKYTLIFERFNAFGGFQFTEGQSYYYISKLIYLPFFFTFQQHPSNVSKRREIQREEKLTHCRGQHLLGRNKIAEILKAKAKLCKTCDLSIKELIGYTY